MTDETTTPLLPLPETLLRSGFKSSVEVYARACVAQATAAKDAEIEALREEVREYLDARACYDGAHRKPNRNASAPSPKHGDPVVIRLREAALRLHMAAGVGNSTDFYKQVEAKRAAQAALDPAAAQEGE